MKKVCRIACVTMVRDEPVLLARWIAHWRGAAPDARLFILADAADQPLPRPDASCHVITLPQSTPASGWEASRWRLLSAFATTLLERFDVVVMNDVDELVVVDPADGRALSEALAEARSLGVIKPFGIEVVHHTEREPLPLDAGQPVLGQRRHGRINALYCKPCIIARPVRWSMGGHFSDNAELHLSKSLRLFHLKAMDRDLLLARHEHRRRHVTDPTGRVIYGVAGAPWSFEPQTVEEGLATFSRLEPQPLDEAFAGLQERMARTWRRNEQTGLWHHDHMTRLCDSHSFLIPDRFIGLI
jgi:hypothetical protein